MPGEDWPIKLGSLGIMELVQRILRSDALGGIASEAVDELTQGAGRSDVLVQRLPHGEAASGGQQVLLDGKHVHLDVAAAVRGRHDGRLRFEKREARGREQGEEKEEKEERGERREERGAAAAARAEYCVASQKESERGATRMR